MRRCDLYRPRYNVYAIVYISCVSVSIIVLSITSHNLTIDYDNSTSVLVFYNIIMKKKQIIKKHYKKNLI